MARRRERDDTRRQPSSPWSGHWRRDGAAKVTYGSQQEALSVADERRLHGDVELSVYRCTFCSGWHMGTANGRET